MNIGPRQARAARSVLACAAGVLALVVLDAQAPPSCTYSAEEVQTALGERSGTIEQSCRFDTIRFEHVCTIRNLTKPGPVTYTITAQYASIADFVDEIRVVPPIARIQRKAYRYVDLPAGDADWTYHYDNDRRQTRVATTVRTIPLVITYNTWDAAGRPTRSGTMSRTDSEPSEYSYDDARRTMTFTDPTSTQVDTYDAMAT